MRSGKSKEKNSLQTCHGTKGCGKAGRGTEHLDTAPRRRYWILVPQIGYLLLMYCILSFSGRQATVLSPQLICRCAAAGIYRAVGKVGGAGLWAYVGYAFEETARICVDGLYQPDRAVQVLCMPTSTQAVS